jgi:signal transduction histidine kinase
MTIASTLADLSTGDYAKLTERATTLLGRASSATTQMVTLVKDLLDLEKLEAGLLTLERRDCSLRDLVEQAVHTVSGISASFNVKVAIDVGDTVKLNADGDRIVQVLVNLLTNAIKFSTTGSEVRVTGSSTNDATTFSVVDSGRGIPAELLASVFERFRQTETSDATIKGGSGLGLAICKALVELHDGTINVDSFKGKGTTFSVSIPKPPAWEAKS